MTSSDPRTFELAVADDGRTAPGDGLVVAFVPATGDEPAVVALACDPRHDPGRPIEALAPHAIAWLQAELADDVAAALWAVVDNAGHFNRALPPAAKVGAGGTASPTVFEPFAAGRSIDAFYEQAGAAGEAAIEMLSALVERPSQTPVTPPMAEFLDAIEAHGSLPAPGLVFEKVSLAAADGDARAVAQVVQPDPVIAATLINYANAARFAAGPKTASMVQAVTRLGNAFVKRVVFVAEMMVRYRRGACPAFDYRGFWANALATGAVMPVLLADFGIEARRADDAFTTGLMSSFGWLVVAETFPALMTRYVERCAGGADPIAKAHAQRDIFPCPIYRVTERYLQRFDFPAEVAAAIAGRSDVDRPWYDALARATRIAQALAPFDCLAIPTTLPVPDACRAAWNDWQGIVASR